ncbi:hypothetical protein DIZ81_06640 [Legionella taurinensis]|uniref:Protein kinase domain-containing protein n=4 Tax=Legionella taurinensis TaxID=70611 RepID=A0AB38N3T1_9GAMM|nr:hypothetical protein DB744_06640 [Legionella taurinensis]PUT41509.1 hypothetical protein DB746_09150 [Legionella taurinensis]PUT44375.1 hypothetical protein DB743_08365 [Legionella taurinensis]PUT48337.1 hypothetical protein DB745_05040 [Legionella taurinensis]TID33715.1 hypothetical protein DIZ41_08365 [Legionella taurinensis]
MVKSMFVSSDEWRVAEYYLTGKPDGTVLPYSALRCPDTGKAIPRPSRPKLFDTYQSDDKKSGPANTFHSFIKIDGEIFAIAQGKTPDAILGEGKYGKVKFIQNKKGELAVVKIEITNNPQQQEETRILEDRALPDGSPLSRGKVERVDKSKYYTHLAYLGVALSKILMNYRLQVALTEPSSYTMQPNTLYVYVKNKQLYGKYMEEEGKIKECPLPRTEGHDKVQKKFDMFIDDYEQFIKNEISSNVAAPELRFCSKMPSDTALAYNTLHLYQTEKGLSYVFKTSEGKITRGHSAGNYPSLSQALNNALLDESSIKSIHASLGFYPRDGLPPIELDENRRLQMAIDIALQVDALHRGLPSSSRSGKPAAHQDLKIENIVMDAKGQCHLIDFGFSTSTPNQMKFQFNGTPMYMPSIDALFFLTQAEIDVVALRRIMTMPGDLNCIAGNHTITEEERKRRSVLTDDMIARLHLANYLQTSSFKSPDMTAMALAAILIAAQLNLGIDYDTLQKKPDQAAIIVAYYRHRKESPTLKQDILKALKEPDLATRVPLAEAGYFETLEQLTQSKPIHYLNTYLKQNKIPGQVNDIEKSRALIEAINSGSSPNEIEAMLNKETLQIRGIIRAREFKLPKEQAALLEGEKSSHVSCLLTFAQNKTQAQHYLDLYHHLSQLELKQPTLAPEYQQASRDLVNRLNAAILALNTQSRTPAERFACFNSSIATAINDNRAALETNTGLTKFLDDICTVLASLIVFYPIVYAYQKKHNVHYSFFKPETAVMLDKIEQAQGTLHEQPHMVSDNPADEGMIAS